MLRPTALTTPVGIKFEANVPLFIPFHSETLGTTRMHFVLIKICMYTYIYKYIYTTEGRINACETKMYNLSLFGL